MKRALFIVLTLAVVGAAGWWFYLNGNPLSKETLDSFSLQYTKTSADQTLTEDVEMNGDKVIITIQDEQVDPKEKIYRVQLTEQQHNRVVKSLLTTDLSQISIREISGQEKRETESLIMVWKEHGVEKRVEKKISSIAELADAESTVRWNTMQRVLKQVIDAAKETDNK